MEKTTLASIHGDALGRSNSLLLSQTVTLLLFLISFFCKCSIFLWWFRRERAKAVVERDEKGGGLKNKFNSRREIGKWDRSELLGFGFSEIEASWIIKTFKPAPLFRILQLTYNFETSTLTLIDLDSIKPIPQLLPYKTRHHFSFRIFKKSHEILQRPKTRNLKLLPMSNPPPNSFSPLNPKISSSRSSDSKGLEVES